MTLDIAKLKAAAERATGDQWVKEAADGCWEAVVSTDDQANGGFIIAEFQGADAQANREFVQAAHPAAVLELIAALEARKLEVIIPPRRCHDYAAVAVQQRDEQWYKALHDACGRAGINLETGGE